MYLIIYVLPYVKILFFCFLSNDLRKELVDFCI